MFTIFQVAHFLFSKLRSQRKLDIPLFLKGIFHQRGRKPDKESDKALAREYRVMAILQKSVSHNSIAVAFHRLKSLTMSPAEFQKDLKEFMLDDRAEFSQGNKYNKLYRSPLQEEIPPIRKRLKLDAHKRRK